MQEVPFFFLPGFLSDAVVGRHSMIDWQASLFIYAKGLELPKSIF